MSYHRRRDAPSYSEGRNRFKHSENRDLSHHHSRDRREEHSIRDGTRKYDQHRSRHERYHGYSHHHEERSSESGKPGGRSRSMSPEKGHKNPSSDTSKHEEEEVKNLNDGRGQESDNEMTGESSVFLKYQKKEWKTKISDSVEGEKKASVLIRCLDQEVTEEQVENAISEVAIRNGFSTPNSVVFKSFHTNTLSGSLYLPEKEKKQYMENYNYGYSLEKVAIVQFPSVSAAGRFMACNKSRSVRIQGKEYYVEYDTTNNDSALKATNESLMPAVTEIANLIQKRKMHTDWYCPSCRFLNFAKRSVCMTCGVPKPSEAELESQNLAIELAALNQAQMLQSNLSDISPWVIIKNIPGDADPAKMVQTVCKNVPDGPVELQKCIYVIDTNAETKRGFMFAQFESNGPVEKYMAKRGDKKSELVQCGNTYHRLDIVKSREKHLAEELFKKVKMANLKVNYEYDTVTQETKITSEDNTMTQLNKQYKTCKVKTTNVEVIQQYVSSTETHSMAHTFFKNWISEWITLQTGKPDTGTFQYDPGTDYFFDHKLSLYYDAATTYYMSLTGNYYLWDQSSSSLKRIDPNSERAGVENQNNRQIENQRKKEEEVKKEGNSISNILASAMKVAQVSQQNVQKLTSVITEKKEESKKEINKRMNIVKTFDFSNNSEEESDMETEEDSKSETKAKSVVESQEKIKIEKTKDKRYDQRNICFVCLRVFESKENLSLHEKESEYHKALLTHIEV